MQNTVSNEETELVRTDSTILGYLSYSNKVGSKLSPLGRERRIKRWQKALISELSDYNKQ